MPDMSSEELLAKVNAIDQEILELTGGDSWEQLGQAAAQAQVVENFLGSVIEDITETREGIEDHVDDLVSAGEQFDELLGIPEFTELLEIPEVEEIIEGLPGGLDDATEVVEEINGGVGKFNEFLSFLQHGEGLTSGNAQEQLEAAAEVYNVFVSKFEPLIDKIPGLGAFVQIWGLSISRAAEVAGVLVETVDTRSDTYADPNIGGRPGKYLYLTDDALRANRITALKQERAELWNQMLETGAAERTATTDTEAPTHSSDADIAIETAIRQSSGAQVPPLTPAYREWGSPRRTSILQGSLKDVPKRTSTPCRIALEMPR